MFDARNIADIDARAVRSVGAVVRVDVLPYALPVLPLLPYPGSGSSRLRPDALEE